MSKLQIQIHQLTFICQTFGLGGAETVNTDLLLAVSQLNHIDVQAFTTFAPFARMLRKAGIRTASLPIEIDIIGDWKGLVKAAALWPFAVVQYLLLVWKSRRTDVIFMSGFFEKIIVTPIAKLFNIPVVWMEFAPMNSLLQKFCGLPGLFYRAAASLPQRIIVPTPHTLRYFRSNFPRVAKEKIIVLPCARYGINPNDYANVRPPTDPVIVCVSRMEQGKGQDLLVETFVDVLKRFPKAELRFVGEGSFETVVKQKVEQLRIGRHVRFLGRVEDSLLAMATATVCVFPSVWELEGFGMVTIEAMALAKPIVAFNIGPSPEIIEDGVTGLLARPADSHDLAKKIMVLLDNKQLQQKLGIQAQHVFASRYAFESIIEDYVQLFEKAKKDALK